MTNNPIQFKWNNTVLTKTWIATSVGKVPVIYFLPDTTSAQNPIVALHYQTGSKEIWLENTTHSPNSALLNYAIAHQIPFYALDLYGHGEWKSEDPAFNPEYLDDEHWELFATKSVTGMVEVINTLSHNHRHKNMTIVAYSVGVLIAVKAIAAGIILKSLVMVSPVPERQADDAYSLHNNVERLKGLKVLLLTGNQDDEVEPGEVDWYFELIESDQKEMNVFDSGHTLPNAWVERAIEFLVRS